MLLWRAAKVGDRDAVRMLLGEGADREWCQPEEAEDSNPCCVAAEEGHQEVVKEMLSGDHVRACERMAVKAIQFSARSGHEGILELLLKNLPRKVLRGSDEVSRALVAAAQGGDKGIVERILLASGLDVDLEIGGCTPLQGACVYGRKDVAEYLLFSGADVNKTNYSHQRTPLFLAAWRGRREVVELLLGAGAEMDTRDRYGRTPLQIASMGGHLEVVRRLLDAGADVDMTDKEGRTPLLSASKQGRKEVVELLLDAGAEVDMTDKYGRTPLLSASKQGHKEVVELLLGSGAEVNAADKGGLTALILASKGGNKEAVQALLDGGAEVDKADNAGKTALYHAGADDHTEVARLLLDSGADLDRVLNSYPGATRLHWASKVGLLGMVRSLLDAGADVNAQDNDWERSPLHWAAAGGHDCSAVVAELLLASGAEVDKVDVGGYSSLAIAADMGNTKVCSVLLRGGADINKRIGNEDGSTAICLAVNKDELVGLLPLCS